MSAHELNVRGLTVRYGAATAVADVAVTAAGGAVTALVGPNGAGKSSVLLGIYGSVAATGTIEVDGRDISNLSTVDRARAGVAIVPQGRALFPRLTVRENLSVLAEPLRLPAGRVDEAIDRFPQLRERVGSLAGVLSGGEQQMLVVSRALMADPKVLLLDELTTGLAPIVVRELLDVITTLSEEGVAILVADPSLAMIGGHVDRGYVLLRGEVAATAGDGGELDQEYQRQMGLVH